MSARSLLLLGLAALSLAACETPGSFGDGRSAMLAPGARAPIDSPKALLGKNEAEVASLLGKPVFTRNDGPAQVWQYSGQSCVLDVFMYREGAAYEVAYVELRRRGSIGAVEDPACLGDALAGPPAGRPAA